MSQLRVFLILLGRVFKWVLLGGLVSLIAHVIYRLYSDGGDFQAFLVREIGEGEFGLFFRNYFLSLVDFWKVFVGVLVITVVLGFLNKHSWPRFGLISKTLLFLFGLTIFLLPFAWWASLFYLIILFFIVYLGAETIYRLILKNSESSSNSGYDFSDRPIEKMEVLEQIRKRFGEVSKQTSNSTTQTEKDDSNSPLEGGAQRVGDVEEAGDQQEYGIFGDLLKNIDFLTQKILNIRKEQLCGGATVFAIDASWGAGKSSFIRIVKNQVQGNLDWVEKVMDWFGLPTSPNKTMWIDFRPWALGDDRDVVGDFFNTLDHELSSRYGSGLGVDIKKYVSLATRFVSPTFVGLSGLVGFEFTPNGETKGPTLNEIHQQLQERLARIEEKIVITIDDIDRMEPQMVLTTLRLVGIVANLPNIIFVLCLDYGKVSGLITKELGQEYDNYLQKIIQQKISLKHYDYEELEAIFLWQLREYEPIKDQDETLKKILEKYFIRSFVKLLVNEEQNNRSGKPYTRFRDFMYCSMFIDDPNTMRLVHGKPVEDQEIENRKKSSDEKSFQLNYFTTNVKTLLEKAQKKFARLFDSSDDLVWSYVFDINTPNDIIKKIANGRLYDLHEIIPTLIKDAPKFNTNFQLYNYKSEDKQLLSYNDIKMGYDKNFREFLLHFAKEYSVTTPRDIKQLANEIVDRLERLPESGRLDYLNNYENQKDIIESVVSRQTFTVRE